MAQNGALRAVRTPVLRHSRDGLRHSARSGERAYALTMSRGVGRDLLRAAHPEPCVAVTLVATLLAASMGASAVTTTTLAVAAFTGQLTVGWLNDLVDVARDRAVGRPDKPLAVGRLSARTVWWCWAAALVATVVTSLARAWSALAGMGW